MPNIMQNKKLPRLEHPVAYRAWLASGMNLAEAARVASQKRPVGRNTVRQWSLDEDWQAHADLALAKIADGIGDDLVADGKLALVEAQALAAEMLGTARALMAMLAANVLSQQADAMDIGAAFRAAAMAVDANDKLYSWSRINVNHSGEVAVISPAELVLLERVREELIRPEASA